MKAITIREIERAEIPLLENFLYNAIFLSPGTEPLPWETIYKPDIYIYVKDFGKLPDDCTFVALQGDALIGAAWTRIIPAFGHIDNETPELATSLLPEYRRRGIGTLLLNGLFILLRELGYRQTSLSVQKANPAVRFYRRAGYEIIREKCEDFIMLKDLAGRVKM